jgi:hypothetical protein
MGINMKHCVLTTKILEDAGACLGYRRHFDEYFNGKAAITTKNLRKATLESFPIDWIACLLPTEYRVQAEDCLIQLLQRFTQLSEDLYDLSPELSKLFEQAYPNGEGFPPKIRN